MERTRLAVFGSVAALDARTPSPAVGAVLDQVYASIAENAPTIAAPILERALLEGRISRVERHELLRELRDPKCAGEGPGTAAVSVGGRWVLREALAAVRRAAPQIARPILADAVARERLTPAQQQRILDRLRTSPASILGA